MAAKLRKGKPPWCRIILHKHSLSVNLTLVLEPKTDKVAPMPKHHAMKAHE